MVPLRRMELQRRAIVEKLQLNEVFSYYLPPIVDFILNPAPQILLYLAAKKFNDNGYHNNIKVSRNFEKDYVKSQPDAAPTFLKIESKIKLFLFSIVL
jgi:hypothetical protein